VDRGRGGTGRCPILVRGTFWGISVKYRRFMIGFVGGDLLFQQGATLSLNFEKYPWVIFFSMEMGREEARKGIWGW